MATLQVVRSESQRKLSTLQFDPIGKLTALYKDIETEIAYQIALRDSPTVRLRADGKPMLYSWKAHFELLNAQQKIASELMRYGYARVAENTEAPKMPPKPMLVKLHDRATPFQIGGQIEDADFEDVTDD